MTPINIFETEYAMPKGYLTGTHRARSPRQTLEDYARFMPLMGITRLANLTGLDTIGLPVYTAIRPNSRALATSQGKGFDADSAKVSALMESIENWHGERIDLPLRWDSYYSLCQSAEVVDVTQLPLSHKSELHLNLPLLWIEGFDLIQQRRVWLPYESVSVNYVYPPNYPYIFHQSTNGLASGNHLLEAIVHGLCEVIEHDATTLWGLTGELKQVDLTTVNDPCCAQTLDLLSRAGAHAVVWDLTSDIGLPVYSCAVLERPDQPNWRGIGSYSGFGCHLSPEVALMRALSEAVQSRVTYIAGSRDDMFRDDYQRRTDEEDLWALWDEVNNPAFKLPFSAHSSLATDSFEGDIAIILSALRHVEIEEAVVVDLTKPEIGVPVVKVVVPGLEGPALPECSLGRRADNLIKENEQ
jgi:ribosomal protein S12 methylthiotransferase accessory factor